MVESKTINKEETRLLDFYRALKEELLNRVTFFQLRPKLTPTQKSNFQGDFDYIICKEDFKTILQTTYELCKNSGINFKLNQKRPNKKAFTFFIKNQQDLRLVVEFWTAIEFTEHQEKKSFVSTSILAKLQNKNPDKLAVLSLLYITHLYHKQKDVFSEENQYRFGVFLKELKEREAKLNTKTAKLLKGLKEKNITLKAANKEAIGLLKDEGVQESNWVSLKYRKLKFFKWNTYIHLSRIVPMVGPDGVGKGSISEKSLQKLDGWTQFFFKRLYRFKFPYRAILPIFAKKKTEPRNKTDEQLGYYIYLMAQFKMRTLLLRQSGKQILMDRYFTDYFAKPIRYLEEGKRPKTLRFYRLLRYFTPTPKRMVFLGCKDSSLVERKNELPLKSVAYLQQIACSFITEKEVMEVLFLSTENEIEASADGLYHFLKHPKEK